MSLVSLFTLYTGIFAISSLLQGGCHLTQDHLEFLTVQGAESRAIHYLALRPAASLCLNPKKASLWGTARQGDFLQSKVTLSSRWLEFQLPLTHLGRIHYILGGPVVFILLLSFFSSLCFFTFLSSQLAYFSAQSWHVLRASISYDFSSSPPTFLLRLLLSLTQKCKKY